METIRFNGRSGKFRIDREDLVKPSPMPVVLLDICPAVPWSGNTVITDLFYDGQDDQDPDEQVD